MTLKVVQCANIYRIYVNWYKYGFLLIDFLYPYENLPTEKNIDMRNLIDVCFFIHTYK